MKVTATRNGIIAGVVVLFAALMLTSVIHAQPGSRSQDGRGMGGGPRGMLPGLRDLELTDVQREAIRDIAEQNRSEGSAMAEQLGAARAALNEVVMDDVVNESMIRMHDQGERRRSALPRRWGRCRESTEQRRVGQERSACGVPRALPFLFRVDPHQRL